jgi:hypothetical protein
MSTTRPAAFQVAFFERRPNYDEVDLFEPLALQLRTVVLRVFQELPILRSQDIARRTDVRVNDEGEAFPRGKGQAICIPARALAQLGNLEAQAAKRVSGPPLKNRADGVFAKVERRFLATRKNIQIL